MIRFSLSCPNAHSFESWFQSGAAFDRLKAAGQISCIVCGATGVEKSLMAPAVRPARKAGEPAAPALSAPGTPAAANPAAEALAAEALAALRRRIEESSDYVGMNFASEARAIHEGEAPDRAIHGEARLDEAKRLIEDGVPVVPLPFLPRRNAN